IPVDVYADRARAAAGPRPAVLPPHRRTLHAELAAVGVHLRQHHDVRRLHEPAYLRRGDLATPQLEAVSVPIGAQQAHGEVDENVGTAPFAAMHAAEETHGRTGLAVAGADAEGMDATFFPGAVGEGDALEVTAMVLLAQHHGLLYFLGREVSAAPHDIAVAAFLDPARDGVAALLLTRAVGGIDLLESSDAVALPLQPLDLVAVDIAIHHRAALVLAKPRDDDAQLGAERGEMAAIPPGDFYVIDRRALSLSSGTGRSKPHRGSLRRACRARIRGSARPTPRAL